MNADQKVTQPSTSTPAPTPPDLRDFPQLDHPYTDIGGKCSLLCLPGSRAQRSVRGAVAHHARRTRPTAGPDSHPATKRDGFIYRWYIARLRGVCNLPTNGIDAGRMAEILRQGFKRGSIQSRYGSNALGRSTPTMPNNYARDQEHEGLSPALLRVFRQQSGLSYPEIAGRLGIHRSTWGTLGARARLFRVAGRCCDWPCRSYIAS
jgi:hypothetical protein